MYPIGTAIIFNKSLIAVTKTIVVDSESFNIVIKVGNSHIAITELVFSNDEETIIVILFVDLKLNA